MRRRKNIRDAMTECGWDAEHTFSYDDFYALVQALLKSRKRGEEIKQETTIVEDGADIAHLVDLIAERHAAKEWLLVQPRELETQSDQENAKETLAFVRKSEAVEIQSFIDASWDTYMRDNPGDEEKPQAVKRAEWARQFFYPLCRQFLMLKSWREKKFPHRFEGGSFLPLIQVTSIACDKQRKQAEKLNREMQPSMLAKFEQNLWKAWDSALLLYKYPADEQEQEFLKFMSQQYFQIMETSMSNKSGVHPRFPFDNNEADSCETIERKHLWQTLDEHDLNEIDSELRVRWEAQLKK